MLAVGAGVLALHALLLMGLPPGAGPEGRAGGVQPLAVRQIVQAPAGSVPAEALAQAAAAPRPRPAPAAADAGRAATPVTPATRAAPEASSARVAPAASPAAEAGNAPAPSDAGGVPLPAYATRLPPPLLARYELRRNLAVAGGELRWTHDGSRYELALIGTLGGAEVLGWTSRGRIDEQGLAPERFVVRRRGRELHAANFQREAGRITFSGPAFELPLVPGVQDRVSWWIQLAAILEGQPALAARGTEVSMLVVGARGDAEVWTFTAGASEPVLLADGSEVSAQRWQREPRRPYDTQAEVWLDPARHHVPVRARLMVRPGGESTEFVLAALEARPTPLRGP